MICMCCGKELKFNEYLYCKECLNYWFGVLKQKNLVY